MRQSKHIWVTLLALLLASELIINVLADDCPPKYEDCIVVKGKKVDCKDGALCDDGFPQNLGADCFKSLVAVPNPRVSSPYGEERPNGPHQGIDIAVPTGTPVFALKDGIVDEIEGSLLVGDRTTDNGNFVRVNHDDGTQGVYIHLEKVLVKNGWGIDAGVQIATSNDTGMSDGPHLHYTEYKTKKRSKGTNDPALVHNKCG